jgi:Multisubunit Na+/H+ antiporter, MnhC subunit
VTPNLVYVVTVGVLFAAGVTMLLERSLTRVLMGVILLGNGANLLILSGGRLGEPPIVGAAPEDRLSDPLPQAMILTAIVITLGMSAFLLAMAYRSWQLVGHDEVRDDVEDRRIAELAERNQGLDTGDGGSGRGDEEGGPGDGGDDGGEDGDEDGGGEDTGGAGPGTAGPGTGGDGRPGAAHGGGPPEAR